MHSVKYERGGQNESNIRDSECGEVCERASEVRVDPCMWQRAIEWRHQKEVHESTISGALGVVFWSPCRPGRREKEAQESTVSRALGIVFWSLCRTRRGFAGGGPVSQTRLFFDFSIVFWSGFWSSLDRVA